MSETFPGTPIYEQLVTETQVSPVEGELDLSLVMKLARDDVAHGGADRAVASYLAVRAKATAERETCPPPGFIRVAGRIITSLQK